MKFISSSVIAIICSLSFLLPSTEIHAQQDFFQPGAEWYYGYKGLLIAERGFTRLSYSRDTTISGVSAKIVERRNYILDYDNPTTPIDSVMLNPLFLAQSGDSILKYALGKFELLWRIDPAVGDSYEVNEYDVFNYSIHVDSLMHVVIDGQEMVIQFITGQTSFGLSGNSIIFDLLGPFAGFEYYSCWGFYDCVLPALCRYKNDVIGTIDIGSIYCENFTTSLSQPVASSIEIYPNPFVESFSVSLNNGAVYPIELELINLSGKIVFSKMINDSFSLSEFRPEITPGMYFGRLVSGHKLYSFKLLKQ